METGTDQGPVADPEGLPTMTTPRQLLVVSACSMLVIGWQTLRYPPDYLAFADLWAALGLLAGLVCAWCAWHPSRVLVTTSGAVLSAICAGRAIAIVRELVTRDFAADELQASFVIAAATWTLVAALFYISWREYVIPWSIGERRHRPRRGSPPE